MTMKKKAPLNRSTSRPCKSKPLNGVCWDMNNYGMRMHACTYVCMFICLCVNACMHECMHGCMCVCVLVVLVFVFGLFYCVNPNQSFTQSIHQNMFLCSPIIIIIIRQVDVANAERLKMMRDKRAKMQAEKKDRELGIKRTGKVFACVCMSVFLLLLLLLLLVRVCCVCVCVCMYWYISFI
jgi:hypothetical protein